MAVTLDTLHNMLRVELPGIPEPLLALAVLQTTQDFFKRSEAWRFNVATLLDWEIAQVFPDLIQAVEIPANTRVVRIDGVKFGSDGTNLKPVPFSTRQQLDQEYPDWEVKTGNTPLRWTNDPTPDAARIIPIAVEDLVGSLQLRVILTPDLNGVDIPDFLYYEYEDELKNGTLARLMKIPGKDWTNTASASAYASLYRNGWMKAKSRVNADYGQPNRIMSYGGIEGNFTNTDDYGRVR